MAYCGRELRRFDRDRYFACLFAGEEGRRALFSLYAFNLEIAKTRETVSEPMIGQIRLQWWREAIEGIYAGTPRNHPVVTALADTVSRCDLTRERFEKMIDGREFDLEERQPETLEELVAYAYATSGELSHLVLEALGVREDYLLTAGRHVGIAWALTGLLKAIPFHASQGRCFLPRAITDELGLSLDDLFAGKGSDQLNRAVEKIAHEAGSHVEKVSVSVHRPLRAAFAPMLLIATDLGRLKKASYDVFAFKPLSPIGRHWKLVKAIRWGRTG